MKRIFDELSVFFDKALQPCWRIIDSPTAKRTTIVQNRFVAAFSCWGGVVSLILLAASGSEPYVLVSVIFAALLFFAPVVCLIVTRHFPKDFLRYWLTAQLCLILLMDCSFKGDMYTTSWPCYLLALDIAVAYDLPKSTVVSILVFITLSLILSKIDDLVRFGLLTAFRGGDFTPLVCDCTDPPCTVGAWWVLIDFFFKMAVVALNFGVLVHFARQLRLEKQKLEASMNVAETLMEHLAGFNVDDAGDLLVSLEDDTETLLPPRLQQAFMTLTHNLQCYRPFLPESMFQQAAFTNQGDNEAPTLTIPFRDNNACVVFTEIAADTPLWEEERNGIRDAVQVHDTIVRQVMGELGGYEVKKIGDSFMLAFESMGSGVAFGIRLQNELLCARWPAALLATRACARDGGGMWCGLPVKVSVHEGKVMSEMNPGTGSLELFGTTVQEASAMLEPCPIGGIVVSKALFDTRVPDAMAESLVVRDLGCVSLRGIRDPVHVQVLYPTHLQGRITCTRYAPTKGPRGDAGDDADSSPPSQRELASCAAAIHTAWRIQRSKATVATVQLDCKSEWRQETFNEWNDQLALVFTHLDRFQGSIVAVMGRSVTVSWNTAQPCKSHLENAFLFCSQLVRRSKDGNGYAVGFSTSKVSYGALGTDRRRFVTVEGLCVGASVFLADVANRRGMRCLYVSQLDTTMLPEVMKNAASPATEADLGVCAIYEHLNILKISSGTSRDLCETSASDSTNRPRLLSIAAEYSLYAATMLSHRTTAIR